MTKIKYAFLLRLEDEALLTKASAGDINKYETEAKKIKTKLLISALKPDERKKIESPKHGKWLSLCDKNKIIFTVCITKNYSETLGNQFIDELVTQWNNNIDKPLAITESEVQDQYYGILTQLVNQYNNPENFDTLSNIDYKLSIAERKVANQIVVALQNTQDLEETDAKAQKLLLEAEQYDDQSNKLKNTMSLRNTKVRIILGLIGGAIICSILITIFR